MGRSIINSNSKIGNHCIINTGSILEHDNVLASFSSIAPKRTGGNVKIGRMSSIGLGSIIKNNIKIGNNINIGSSSFVNKNCIKKGTYIGSPIKNLNEKSL